MAMISQGGCFCGKVRYRLKAAPMFVNCCHCRDCQRQSGSAFVVNGMIEAEEVELLSGEPEPVSMRTDSGHPHDIFRCRECRSAVWSDYGRRGWMLFIRLATLDDPGRFPPDAHIFTCSRLPWVNLDGGAPAFDIYYEMEKLWPPESLERRQRARLRAGAER
ncbi:GFA family protein [Ciceribacter sp. L1K23]|nr:GFA family protein [Ciceribacter sp. L1K23]MBR0556041.1 GFA family protein [Ciceribacter sp. L1K23]